MHIIAKRCEMAQVNTPGMGYFPYLLPVLLCCISACSPPQSVTPGVEKTPPPPVESPPVEIYTASPDMAEPDRLGDVGPMSGWTVATRLADFHDTWTANGALSARGPAGPNALVPYVDAVAYQGESWGLATPVPELILLDREGHAYRYPDGRHGLVPAEEKREPVEDLATELPGWAALEAGETLHIRHAGSLMYVLGALRATGHCGKCHDGDGRDLLGAFRYRMHEIADD